MSSTSILLHWYQSFEASPFSQWSRASIFFFFWKLQVFYSLNPTSFHLDICFTPLHEPMKEENLINVFCWSIATIVKKKFVREKVALPWTSRFCDGWDSCYVVEGHWNYSRFFFFFHLTCKLGWAKKGVLEEQTSVQIWYTPIYFLGFSITFSFLN